MTRDNDYFSQDGKSKSIVITGSEFVLNYFIERRSISISMQARTVIDLNKIYTFKWTNVSKESCVII